MAGTKEASAPTVKEMAEQLKEMQKLLQERSTSGVALARNGMFAGGFDSPPQGAWPDKLLGDLAKAYDDNAVQMLLRQPGGGAPRITGMGPALKRLVDMKAGKNPGYNDEKFEAEFGFTSLDIAKDRGIKQLNGEYRKTALAESSGLTGGYIIPPQFVSRLQTIAMEDAFIEQRAQVMPMASRQMTLPMLDITTARASGISPYLGGVQATWQPEAATISEFEPQFKQSTWTAWDLVLYSVASNQLLQDNGIGLDALLTQLFGNAITWYKEYAWLRGNGAGASMPMGILNAPATIAVNRTTASKVLLPDLANMLAHLQVRSRKNACWIIHQSVLPQLIQMSDYLGSGNVGSNLSWMSPLGDGKTGPVAMKLPDALLDGLPLFVTEKLPQLGTKGDVMLVDWSNYVIGNRLDIQIDVSKDFLFRTNQLAWRVIARCDGQPWLNSYITDASGYQVSPFIVLN